MVSRVAHYLPIAIRALVAKVVVGLAVFVPTVGSYVIASTYLLAHRPLPGSGAPPAACSLWLIGSSSIYRWHSAAAMLPGWSVNNRGIEGALLDRIQSRLDSTPAEHPPTAVLVYAGENDIAHGATADQAARSMAALIATIAARAPGAPIFLVSMKPSPTRWPDRAAQLRYDAVMRHLAMQRPRFTFLGTSRALLTDGRPGDYYQPDGIHLSDAGYRRWGGAIGAALNAAPTGRCAASATHSQPATAA